jgi:hypothetical protein
LRRWGVGAAMIEDDDLLGAVFGGMTRHERALSLAIDACHEALWHLQGERGVRTWAMRLWWTWKLRRLEARIGL